MIKLILIGLALTVVGIIVFSVVDNVTNGSVEVATSIKSSEAEEDSITVSLSGEVNKPGKYYVNNGDTLEDAIYKASGLTSNADELAFNLDYVIEEAGLSFYIAPLYDNSNTCSVTPITKVNVNEADEDELQTVSGFGSTVSEALVEYREKNGDFLRIEEIKNVSGIGDATFSKVKNYITLRS